MEDEELHPVGAATTVAALPARSGNCGTSVGVQEAARADWRQEAPPRNAVLPLQCTERLSLGGTFDAAGGNTEPGPAGESGPGT
jgi:hypothetical protein